MEDALLADDAYYRHVPLKHGQIRLVKVRYNRPGLPQCEIVVVSLQQAPPFSTLSYVWGPPTPMRVVLIDNKRFEVRQTLHGFLKEFRNADRYLWIDQLSIDQENVEERNRQVALMSCIYTRCTSVIMWLGGESRGYTRAALDLDATASVSSIATLLRHQYFTRLWVIQEILLPSDVDIFVGSNAWVPWVKFSEVVLRNKGQLEKLGVPYTALALVENRRNETGQKTMRLETCVQLFSGNQCGDARDKVYGLMGLVHTTERVNVDYSKSPHEVYLDVVCTFCKLYLSHLQDPDNCGDNYHLTLAELGKSMHFTHHEVEGILCFLSELFQRLEELKCSEAEGESVSSISVGFEVANRGEAKGAEMCCNSRVLTDRWWFDWQGERYFF